MADNDNNDEYQFADLDAINPEAADDQMVTEGTVSETTERKVVPSASNNVKRNALIVVAIVIIAMLLYKFLGSYLADRKVADASTIPTPTSAPTPSEPIVTPPPRPEALTEPSQIPPQPIVSSQNTQSDPMVEQKLSAMEVSQQSMRAEVTAVNNQLGGISNNVNNLGTQIAQLNRMIADLSSKVESQSQVIEILSHPKPVKVKRAPTPAVHVTRFYIQAVIPGRAWLISPNGATLTVREGTSIPGYGIVKLIDPSQGRITTSTGQVIRFSQEDS